MTTLLNTLAKTVKLGDTFNPEFVRRLRPDYRYDSTSRFYNNSETISIEVPNNIISCDRDHSQCRCQGWWYGDSLDFEAKADYIVYEILVSKGRKIWTTEPREGSKIVGIEITYR